ncbi:MAG: YraN family protein [Dehalococcoidia bacterium]|nr:YraN family protein [Dehalococcoidia bacterium]
MKRSEIGNLGEKAAVNYLKRHKKFRIKETNFRCPMGEIDIIAEHKKCLIFIEVRTRSSAEFGTPEESITSAKKHKLGKLVQSYIQTLSKLPRSWRIDVLAIEVSPGGEISRIELIENAIAEPS